MTSNKSSLYWVQRKQQKVFRRQHAHTLSARILLTAKRWFVITCVNCKCLSCDSFYPRFDWLLDRIAEVFICVYANQRFSLREMMKKVYAIFIKMGGRMTEAETIANRIEQAISGTAFTAFDFSDISSARNAGNVLGRMYSKWQLAKAIRGVYHVLRLLMPTQNLATFRTKNQLNCLVVIGKSKALSEAF